MKEIIEAIFRAGIIYGIIGTISIEGIILIIWWETRKERGKRNGKS